MRLPFRTKLTLVAVTVIGLSMVGFGGAQIGLHRVHVQNEIDRDLAFRARPLEQGMAGPPFGPGRGGGPGGMGPGGRGLGMRRQFGGPPPGGPPPNSPPPANVSPSAESPVRSLPPTAPDDRPQREPPAPANLRLLSDLEFWQRPVRVGRDGLPLAGDGSRSVPDPEAVQAALGGQRTVRNVRFEGRNVRAYTAPWVVDGEPVGAVQVIRDLTDFEFQQAAEMRTFLLLLPGAMLIAGLAAWTLAGSALRPVERMRRMADQIGAEDLSKRLPGEADDELGRLAGTFNGLLTRLEVAFARERRFTADAAHELRTPLARIRLASSAALESSASPDDLRRAVEVAGTAAENMTQLVEDLLLIARAESGQSPVPMQRIDLRIAAQEAAEEHVSLGLDRLRCELGTEPLWVVGNIGFLRRAVANLIDNARIHGPSDRPIVVRTRRTGDLVVVEVEDGGPAIDPAIAEALFNRFTRLDSSRGRESGGTGLGLAIVRAIADIHGGHARFASDLKRGNRVEVLLPLAPQSS
ncbi:MAG: ATP-binding protein [Fimbriimonadaceae bacterium]